MTPRHALMVIGLVVGGWLAFFADKSPNSGVVEPITGTSASATISTFAPQVAVHHRSNNTPPSGKAKQEVTIMALRQRDNLIGGATEEKRADELFGSQTWTPPPPPPPKPPPPPPPTAPPLPFTYLGKKAEDNKWEAFLARGNQTFIVREQTVIEGRYRVDSVKPPTLSLTYLPLNQVQTLNIGGTD